MRWWFVLGVLVPSGAAATEPTRGEFASAFFRGGFGPRILGSDPPRLEP